MFLNVKSTFKLHLLYDFCVTKGPVRSACWATAELLV